MQIIKPPHDSQKITEGWSSHSEHNSMERTEPKERKHRKKKYYLNIMKKKFKENNKEKVNTRFFIFKKNCFFPKWYNIMH